MAVVGEIYAAFARGDVPSILAAIADDCAWDGWTQNTATRRWYLLPAAPDRAGRGGGVL